jgi:hypothetical protein
MRMNSDHAIDGGKRSPEEAMTLSGSFKGADIPENKRPEVVLDVEKVVEGTKVPEFPNPKPKLSIEVESDTSAPPLSLSTPEPILAPLAEDIDPATMGKEGPKVEGNEESMEARIERMGRERPSQFKSAWAECGFVFSVVMSQALSVSAFPSPINVQVIDINRNTSSLGSPSFFQLYLKT